MSEHIGRNVPSGTGKSDACRKLAAGEYLSRIDALLEDALAIHVYISGRWWQPWAGLRKHHAMRMKLAEARSLGWHLAAIWHEDGSHGHRPETHRVAGRMINNGGAVTFCSCGLAFFAPYPGTRGKFGSADERHHACATADLQWQQHVSGRARG